MPLPCRDCASGHLHPHTPPPTGTVETLHGLPCYIAAPPQGTEPKGIVVIISDAFGWELPNTRCLADRYAEEGGWRVVVPDFMGGHWLAHEMLDTLDTVTDPNTWFFWKAAPVARLLANFAPWAFYTRSSLCSPRIYAFFRALRASNPDLPLGAAGFCWGGKYTVLLCSGVEKSADGTKPLVDCGFTAHPSFLSVPADLDAVTIPLSIANGTKDIQLKADMLPVVETVFEGKRKEGVDCELVVYEGAKHGFAIRGNPKDEAEMRMGDRAVGQAVGWFGRFLGGGAGKD